MRIKVLICVSVYVFVHVYGCTLSNLVALISHFLSSVSLWELCSIYLVTLSEFYMCVRLFLITVWQLSALFYCPAVTYKLICGLFPVSLSLLMTFSLLLSFLPPHLLFVLPLRLALLLHPALCPVSSTKDNTVCLISFWGTWDPLKWEVMTCKASTKFTQTDVWK